MNPGYAPQFRVQKPQDTDHNGQIMASRISALIIWAAVAASLAYWGLRWMARPTGVPLNATPVSMDTAAMGDFRRLLAGPSKAASGAAPTESSVTSALMARLKLLGVVAPREGRPEGVALLSIDGKPPRAVRLGGTVDGDLILQKLTQRSAEIGPADGPALATLDLPLLPPPATGALPPPTGVSTTGTGARASTPGGATPPGGLPNGMVPPGGTMSPGMSGAPNGMAPEGPGLRANGA